jgi:hypothetical protein
VSEERGFDDALCAVESQASAAGTVLNAFLDGFCGPPPSTVGLATPSMTRSIGWLVCTRAFRHGTLRLDQFAAALLMTNRDFSFARQP